MRVLALDPGDKVGWARADVDEATGQWSDLRHGIAPLKDMAVAVHRALIFPTIVSETEEYPEWDSKLADYDLIVMEDWRLYPHMAKTMVGSSFPSVQFVGMVRLCCWLSGTKLVTQGAAIKSTADKTMTVLNPDLYEKVTQPGAHDDQHDLDALRHLHFWTWKNTPLAKGVK